MKRYSPFKNIRRRLVLWWILINILFLADEWLKEGYLFKPSDILVPLTHEDLMVLANLFFAILYIVIRRRVRDG